MDEPAGREGGGGRVAEGEVRRSFLLGVANGTLFRLAETLVDPSLVLVWFVSRLTGSNLLIGMVSTLGMAGWFLPQTFVSNRVQRMPRKMPLYSLCAAIRQAAWLLLAIAVWLVRDPGLLLGSFFLLYGVARLASGPSGLAFLDVVAKTIPIRRRGRFFTWRHFLGSVLGLGGSWAVGRILAHPALPFPRGQSVLFLLYGLVTAPAFLAFMAIREPPGAAIPEPVTVAEQVRRAGRLLHDDPVYRRYLVARLSLGLSGIVLPFYGLYARNVLGAPEEMVSVYLAAGTAGQLLFNLPWGRVSDRRGNRLVMRVLTLGKGGISLLALALVGMVALVEPQGAWLPYLVVPLFFANGALFAAGMLSGSNYLMELVPEAERPLYLGFTNTLNGVVSLVAGLGGLLVDVFGFAALFAASLVLCLVAYAFAARLPERQEVGR